MCIRFARKANDHIHTNGAMRHQGFDEPDPFGIQFFFIPPSHQTKYIITATLQWNMKMRHKLITVGYKFNDFIGQ